MANTFSEQEWTRIMKKLRAHPQKYGFPERRYETALIGSFNIRKLGSARNRNAKTWEFLAAICRQFDLLAVQEVLDDLSGLNHLMQLLGPDFKLIVSDKTGVFPGVRGGAGERLGFIYYDNVVQPGEMVSDISYDRSKVIEILADNYDAIHDVMQPYAEKYKKYKAGEGRKPRNPKLPIFLSFIRQPYCVSFTIKGRPGCKPFEFMAVNAHLLYGQYMSDRRQEFDALMEWIIQRVQQSDKPYYPNFLLLGDLNLDFDDPDIDRKRIEKAMKTYDKSLKKNIDVYFPFLDPHPKARPKRPFRTNARQSETFDHIGFFLRKDALPFYMQKASSIDYGMFNFVELFRATLSKKTISSMSKREKKNFYNRFEHKVSDHMPIWVRLPRPHV